MSVFVIAEAGVNHNGDLKIAKKLVDVAKDSGADCVKFQTFNSENVVSKRADKAEYQKASTNPDESQLDMLKKLELTFDEFVELNEYCKCKGIEFMSTAFGDDSIDFLNNLGMKLWKISSGDITNLPHLIKVARLGQKVILSTGMSTMKEIEDATRILKENGSGEIIVLHCTTEYPAPYEEVNLNAMNSIKDELSVEVGYSDHTSGIEVAVAAVALGAKVIEKHFTLDKNMEGPDHKASLEPKELKEMVASIRHVSLSLGIGHKKPSKSEIKNMQVARKSIVAKTKIMKNEVFTEENLTIKRPGTGISPMQWFDVIGKTACKDFEEDELIDL